MKRMMKLVAMVCSLALLVSSVPAMVPAQEDEDTALLPCEVIDTTAADDVSDVANLSAEDVVGELEDRREADMKHFLLTDGSVIALSYPVAVHEQVDGVWEDIDNTLEETTDSEGNSVLQTRTQQVKYAFVNGKGNGRLIKAEDTASGARVIFELEEAQKKNLVLEDTAESEELFAVPNVYQKGTYTEILPDTDIEYIFAGTTLKENIVFKTADAAGAVSFLLRTKHVTATLQEDQRVVLADTEGNTVFTIPAPYMYDALGDMSTAVTVTLTPTDQGYRYTMIPDTAWTQDEARTYPITLDPVVESGIDPKLIHATFIKESDPDASAYDESVIWVGNNASNSSCYGLLKFDLPTLKSSDYVIGSYIQLFSSNLKMDEDWSAWDWTSLSSSTSTETPILEVHAVNESWDNTVTWSNQPQYESSVLDAVTLEAKHTPQISQNTLTVKSLMLNVTELAQQWYTGRGNYGVLFKLNIEDDHVFAAEFLSDLWMMDEANDIMMYQPQIIIQYRSKAGLEDVYSYASVSAGTAGSGYVQLNSGNLTFVHADVGLDGGSMSVSITHVYNTCHLSSDIGYGRGWRINYAQTLTEEIIGEETYYAYTDADATKHYFRKDSDKTELKDESGLELTLTLGSSNIISDKEDTQWIFNTAGYLTEIKNAYGESILIAYDSTGTRISTITDGLGREYAFAYGSSELLESITDPSGRYICYGYEKNNLITIKDEERETGEIYYTNTYAYNSDNVLVQASSSDGDCARMDVIGKGSGSRVNKLQSGTTSDETAVVAASYAEIEYGAHQTVVTDEQRRTVTYQFNSNGNTRCIYNSEGQAQYYRYYAPNEQNENGTSTYGPNKLEASSQTQWVACNLLYDHGFESVASWNGHVVVSTSDKYEGHKSLVFDNSTDSAAKIAYQTVSLPSRSEQTAYTLSAYVKTVQGGTDAAMELFVDQGAAATVLGSASVEENQDWQRVQLTFTLPASSTATTVRVCAQKTGDGIGYVDSIQLEKGVAANRYNLLQNGDLSYYTAGYAQPYAWSYTCDGTAGIWTNDEWASPAPSSIGLNAAHYTASSWQYAHAYDNQKYKDGSAKTLFTATLSQTVAVGYNSSGSTLSYGSWMCADSLPEAYDSTSDTTMFGIRITLLDGNGTVKQTQFTPANRHCEKWQFVGDVIVAKSAFASVKIELLYKNNANVAYFDGAYIYADYFGQSYTYDDDGNVISTQAYADQQSSFSYSGNDDLTQYVSPDGASYTYTYNDKHDVETGTSAEGVTYAYAYEEEANLDETGLVTSAQTVLGTALNTAQVTFDYDSAAGTSVETVTDVRGNAVTYTYNADGTIATATDATGVATSYTYDGRRRTTGVTATDADGETLSAVTYTYDAQNRLSAIQNGDVCYYFTYDTVNRVTAVSVGTAADHVTVLTENTYRAATNGVESTQISTLEYGNGDSKTYRYDQLDRVVGVRFEDDTIDRFTYVYDKEGNLASSTDTDTGVTVSYQYDLSRRLSQM